MLQMMSWNVARLEMIHSGILHFTKDLLFIETHRIDHTFCRFTGFTDFSRVLQHPAWVITLI